jgi:hypothetical protein
MFKHPMWLYRIAGQEHQEEHPEIRNGEENLVIAYVRNLWEV